MPFLPLYFQLLGVRDVGEIALWSGLSLGVTPALTALLSPFWGRLADRYGRKIMVERSLVSFVFVMTAMAFVSRPWHVFALRAAQGLFAGYGALMRGVRFFGHGIRTSSIVMQNEPHQIRFIDTIHVLKTDEDLRIRF